MQKHTIIVGGGIIGLAFAYEAWKRGRRVSILERDDHCQGASVRNFGMIWPIGQTEGENYQTAIRSRELWIEIASKADVWIEPCGSLHLAHHQLEADVLEEFYSLQRFNESRLQILSKSQILKRYPLLNPDHLLSGLRSESECVVNPPQAVQNIAAWLQSQDSVTIHYGQNINKIDMPNVYCSNGKFYSADEVLVCTGKDHKWLFPDDFERSGIRLCKLQMLASNQGKLHARLSTHLAAGLTLCHYKSFESCDSLNLLREYYANTHSEYLKYGIHVMLSQNNLGEYILGDSHEYDQQISFDQSERIDQLILNYLQKMITIKTDTITRRWYGIYAKHPTKVYYSNEIQPNCTILNGFGGAGMTLSFGIAESWWNQHENSL